MIKQQHHPQQAQQQRQPHLRIIPLGGLGEVGRNMMLVEWQEQILILDMGFRMPEENMPGVDFLVPNIEYLKNKRDKIVGIVFSHGHYDHIGAVPYLIDKIWSPRLRIFAAPLAKAIIMKRQDEFPNLPKLDIEEAKDQFRVQLGPFQVEFFKQNHNIPDDLGILIGTPEGNIIYTSDFKFDPTPVNDLPTDFQKLKNIGKRKILLLMQDSTGALAGQNYRRHVFFAYQPGPATYFSVRKIRQKSLP
jgi:ribonuclease J